ncbi:MAG: 4Fe-4S ferredoxin [Methanobacteriota archaeon]|nr:MAG: 4Fe-4S ferredoxin [Euryarchaeota archaeon]
MVVHFTPWNPEKNMFRMVEKLYESSKIFDMVDDGDLVAVKLHVGEWGAVNTPEPIFIHGIVERVKSRGGKPFLTDSCTYYRGMRNNAVDHAANALANGYNSAPFISADGLRGENGVRVATRGVLDAVDVAGVIAGADAMVVVTHAKGHPTACFGGAVKNVGMGCTTREAKLVQHRCVELRVDPERCTGCGTCVEVCPYQIPKIVDGKAVIDSPRCMRCPICSSNCPSGAIKIEKRENIDKALASAVYAVLSTFKPGKVCYITFAKGITPLCDCVPGSGRPIHPDLGVYVSNSIIEVDAAVLKHLAPVLDARHGGDSWAQIKELKKLGLEGSLDPEVIEIK